MSRRLVFVAVCPDASSAPMALPHECSRPSLDRFACRTTRPVGAGSVASRRAQLDVEIAGTARRLSLCHLRASVNV